MKDRFSFNVCSFIGMFVTLLTIVGILKSFNINISPIKVVMMIGLILLFALFADSFFKVLFYFFVARIINYPWLWSEQRENLSYFVREDLKEYRLSEIVTITIVLAIGYYFTCLFLSPYSFQLGPRLNSVILCLAALWLGGLIIGGILYAVLNSFSDNHNC